MIFMALIMIGMCLFTFGSIFMGLIWTFLGGYKHAYTKTHTTRITF